MIDGLKNFFTNNLLIYVKKRDTTAASATGVNDWAVLGQFIGYGDIIPEQIFDNVLISGNVGQGSEESGFFFYAAACDKADVIGNFGNTVSSTRLAGISYK